MGTSEEMGDEVEVAQVALGLIGYVLVRQHLRSAVDLLDVLDIHTDKADAIRLAVQGFLGEEGN